MFRGWQIRSERLAVAGFMAVGGAAVDPSQTQWTTSASAISFSGLQNITPASSTFGNLPVGTIVTVYERSNPSNIMQGTVASGSEGSTLKVVVTASSGSPSGVADWIVGTEVLYVTSGVGVYYLSPPILGSQMLTYTDRSAGLEQLVSYSSISPWGSSACSALGTSTSVPIVGVEDRAFFNITNPSVYPSSYGPQTGNTLTAGWSLDWMGQRPKTLLGVAGQGLNQTAHFKSNDCGHTWSPLLSSPPGTYGGVVGGTNAEVAAIAASTATNIVSFSTAQSGGTWYTTDDGATWTIMTFPNVPTTGMLTATGSTPKGGVNVEVDVPPWLASDITNGYSISIYDINTNTNSGSVTIQSTTATMVTLGTGGFPADIHSGDKLLFRYNVNSSTTNNGFQSTLPVASDKVDDETFYAFNDLGGASSGFFKTTNGGATWTQECQYSRTPSTCPFGAGANEGLGTLKATPGHAGDLWFTMGATFNQANHPSETYLWHSANGGATWAAVSNVEEPWCFGLGKAMPGSDKYPTLYVYGWINQGGGYVGGLWRAENIDGTPIWKQLSSKFPLGSLDQVTTCEGDANVAGKAYLGFVGSGWQVYDSN